MKKLFLLLGLFGSFAVASAQNDLGVGNMQLNAGLGLSSWGTPVYLGVDYGIVDNVTIGGEVSYRTKTYYNVKYTSFGFAANVNYHFNELLKLPSEIDLYGGASVGYYSWSHNYNGTGYYDAYYDSGLGVGLQIGGRYFFTKDFGINLELGGGTVSGGKLGITYKF